MINFALIRIQIRSTNSHFPYSFLFYWIILTTVFEATQYPDCYLREAIASTINLSESRVQVIIPNKFPYFIRLNENKTCVLCHFARETIPPHIPLSKQFAFR